MPFGLFEFTVMTSGLRNAAQSFQCFVNDVLRGLDFCVCCIDNILVASENAEQHMLHLRMLFERLDKFGVVVNIAKCTFSRSEIEYLGYNINQFGIASPASRVEAIRNYKRSATVKDLRRFLGSLNYYRRFILKAADH